MPLSSVVISCRPVKTTVIAVAVVTHLFVQLDNSRCLAQKGSCFACIDHCPKEAVNIALGVGIVVDPELCDGCGECAAVCPVYPKIIEMKPVDRSQKTRGKEK